MCLRARRRPVARQDWGRGLTSPNGMFVTGKDGTVELVRARTGCCCIT